MPRYIYKFWLAGGVFFWYLMLTSLSQAQIVGDTSLPTPTKVTNSDNRNFTITGGSRAGGNLFHSFEQFSVPSSGSAIFKDTGDVNNIISRVTGGSISEINGLIEAHGDANLFLINPKGIIFGSGASLKIGGSFLATTANDLIFADGTFFSATASQTQPLLTISTPIGLQFGKIPGSIRIDGQSFAPYLQMKPGQTLAFVGGEISIKGGFLNAPEGRIELGSVGNNSRVGLKPSLPIEQGWSLNYEGVQNFQDIYLSQVLVNTSDMSGLGSGAIQLRGRQISLVDKSNVVGLTLGKQSGESIAINASEFVVIGNFSLLSTDTFGSGKAGNIIITTPQLIVKNGGQIRASTRSSGQGGNITINAPRSVEAIGRQSLINSRTFSTDKDAGNAGTLNIKTEKLIVSEGGRIDNSTEGTGDAGNLKVDASLVEVSGRSEDGIQASGLFSQTIGGKATGNAGSLEINTEQLIVRDGASISVGAIEETFRSDRLGVSTGQGGELNIQASDFVEVTGTGLDNEGQVVSSTLIAESQGTGNAGNLTIATDNLIIRDGAQVSVSSSSPEAQAGNLTITANTVILNQGRLTAETNFSQGNQAGANINLQGLNLLRLENESLISATASGEANGGNIDIDTKYLIALPSQGFDGNDIIANARFGNGGNINITAQRLFGIESRSQPTQFNDITASSEFGTNGVIEINTPEFEPTREELPANLVDVSRLIEQNLCRAGRGSQFTVTGRSGLPNSPNEAFSSNEIWEDWRIAESSQQPVTSPPTVNRQKAIVEAQGWVVNSQGKVVLTTEPIATVPRTPLLTQSGCI
jgi:filamentous hemagglutinin family protein